MKATGEVREFEGDREPAFETDRLGIRLGPRLWAPEKAVSYETTRRVAPGESGLSCFGYIGAPVCEKGGVPGPDGG